MQWCSRLFHAEITPSEQEMWFPEESKLPKCQGSDQLNCKTELNPPRKFPTIRSRKLVAELVLHNSVPQLRQVAPEACKVICEGFLSMGTSKVRRKKEVHKDVVFPLEILGLLGDPGGKLSFARYTKDTGECFPAN